MSEDARAIVGFDPEWDEARWLREIEAHRVWVEEAQEGVIAGLCRWAIAGELELHRIIVAPSHRRRGLAAAMLRAAIAADPGPWLLEVASRNRGARALYDGLGFLEVGRRAGYYRDGDDAILMRRDP